MKQTSLYTVLTVLMAFLMGVAGFLGWLIYSSGEQQIDLPSLISEVVSPRESRGMHSALIGQESLVERSYKYRPESIQDTSPRGLIVNHHLLAGDLIAQAFGEVEGENMKHVILIAPNHFHQGGSNFITSEYDWKTPDGIVQADLNFIDGLLSAEIDEEAISGEHGISNIMPFIKRSLPNAQVTTIMVRDDVNDTAVELFARELALVLPANTLIVGSFDFSHDALPQSADYHDQMAYSVVARNDIESVNKLDIDSRPGLKLMMKLMQDQSLSFHRLAMTNSSVYTKNPYQSDVTSYLTGYYSEELSDEDTGANLLFFGDMMLDRHVRFQLNRHGNDHPFEELGRFLWGSDHIISNLEGTVTDYSSIYVTGEEEENQFTFDPSVIETFKRYGFDAFSLANNHSHDFGQKGLDETRQRLDDAQINYFGDYHNKESISTRLQARDQSVSLVGFHQFGQQNLEGVLEEIIRLSELGDFVIVTPHWGNEYQLSSSRQQQDLAHQFVDAGADLIIGAHPHVIQPLEIYHGKPIFYSLGNFVFDQQQSEEVKKGLSLGVTIKDESSLIYLFPLHITPSVQVEVFDPQEAEAFYQDFVRRSKISADLQDQLKAGLIEIIY